MDNLFDKIGEAFDYLVSNVTVHPHTAIVLGTGLGALSDRIKASIRIPYKSIPHFPVSTVESHKGELVFGKLAGKNVVAMSGRFHYYEGYSSQEITFPIRVFKALKVRNLIISNASGGINPHYHSGQVVALNDHINLMPEHPLRGKNDDRLGVRFPDMKCAYSEELLTIAREAADSIGYNLKEGVYVGFQGPSLETPAEYKFLNIIGGDMVGMSTVPEVIVAKHCEIPTLVLSLISNMCYPPDRIKETSLEDVIAVTNEASPMFCRLVEKIISSLED